MEFDYSTYLRANFVIPFLGTLFILIAIWNGRKRYVRDIKSIINYIFKKEKINEDNILVNVSFICVYIFFLTRFVFTLSTGGIHLFYETE